MFSRYDNRRILTNSDPLYKEFFRQRGVSFIKQYETPTLHYPSPEDIAGFQIVAHTWGVGSALWKLAAEYYGDAELHWIIAFYNGVMIEQEFKVGSSVYIPLPLERVLRAYGI